MSKNVAFLQQNDIVNLEILPPNSAAASVVYLNEVDPVTLDIIPASPQLVLELGTILVLTPSVPTSYVSIPMIASINISIHTVVAPDGTGGVVYATNDNISQVGKPMGLAFNSALAGDTVIVVTAGEVDEPTWNWQPGEVYLGINGMLTQTPPTSGILQVVGVALTPTRLSVGIQLPILLN